MNSYSLTELRSNMVAAIFALFFSAVCLTGVLAPAHNATATVPAYSLVA
jgi:hypothetical protein